MEKRWFHWVVRSLILREILKVTNFWSPSDRCLTNTELKVWDDVANHKL